MTDLATELEALAVLEIDGLARAALAHDAALKKASVRVLASAPVSTGRVVLAFAGSVAETEEALVAADAVAGSRRMGVLMLPGVTPALLRAMCGERLRTGGPALGVLEMGNVCSTLAAADHALKSAAVGLADLHLATGYGGRGFFTLRGEQADVEAAIATLEERFDEQVLDVEVIPAPHDELEDSLLRRPWALDPSRTG